MCPKVSEIISEVNYFRDQRNEGTQALLGFSNLGKLKAVIFSIGFAELESDYSNEVAYTMSLVTPSSAQCLQATG